MPNPLAVGQYVEVTPYCFCNNQLGLNVLHYRVQALVGTPPQDSDVAFTFATGFAPLIKPMLAQEAQYLGVKVQIIKPTRLVAVTDNTGAGAGTSGVSVLPKQVAGLLSKRTVNAGRAFRGRAYIPFPSEDDSDTYAVPNAGYSVNLVNMAVFLGDQLHPVVAGNILTPIIYHRKTGTATDISIVLAANKFATIRKRGDYGRVNANSLP